MYVIAWQAGVEARWTKLLHMLITTFDCYNRSNVLIITNVNDNILKELGLSN